MASPRSSKQSLEETLCLSWICALICWEPTRYTRAITTFVPEFAEASPPLHLSTRAPFHAYRSVCAVKRVRFGLAKARIAVPVRDIPRILKRIWHERVSPASRSPDRAADDRRSRHDVLFRLYDRVKDDPASCADQMRCPLALLNIWATQITIRPRFFRDAWLQFCACEPPLACGSAYP